MVWSAGVSMFVVTFARVGSRGAWVEDIAPLILFFFSSRRRHTRWTGDWSSDVCSSDLCGKGRTPWLALATLLLVVPLVGAFTVRPAVFAGQDRLRVRNPFRVIVLPWGQVEMLRSRSEERRVGKEGRSRWAPYD